MECSSSLIFQYFIIFKRIIGLIQLIAPIIAIIFVIVTLIKMITNPEEKKLKKELQNKFIALVMVFIVPILVNVTVTMIVSNSDNFDCLEEEEIQAIDGDMFKNLSYLVIEEDERKQISSDPSKYDSTTNNNETNNSSNDTTSSNQNESSSTNAVYFLNVGASTDAIIIQDQGKFGLIDTSYSGKADYIVNQLKKLGATELDFVMISHTHIDHIGGFNGVFSKMKVNKLYIKNPSGQSTNYLGTYKRLINKARSKGTSICVVGTPECNNFKLGNINFKLYNTEFQSAAGLTGKNKTRFENCNSTVALATINNRTVYFAGDIGNYFGHNRESIVAKQIGDIDIYKAAHHGYTSFNNHHDALNNLQAEYAVVTNNRQRSNSGVKRIKKANKNYQKTYYTTDGTVMLHIDENGKINFSQYK